MAAKRRREHFGAGVLSLNPATSVFLNCPYDPEYQALFDAAVLSVACCGFTPRSALETGTFAESRMARIVRAIFESKYSIHDLSRCQGEGDANLARFNMPLELGIAMARRYLAKHAGDRHDYPRNSNSRAGSTTTVQGCGFCNSSAQAACGISASRCGWSPGSGGACRRRYRVTSNGDSTWAISQHGKVFSPELSAVT